MPGWTGFTGAKEAADIYGRAVGRDVSEDLFRDWLRDDDGASTGYQNVDGFERTKFMDRWMIDKIAMLDELERRARLILAVVEEEREKMNEGEK